MYIKSVVKEEIHKIYRYNKKKERSQLKKQKKDQNKRLINERPRSIIEENKYPVEIDADSQSYMDPIGRESSNIEYQGYNNSPYPPTNSQENILMRDIMDNTPNNRFQ